MNRGYFLAAWDDLRASKGWVRKVLLLGLVCLIPVFGLIVLLGYAYGWARDIAWNVKSDLPPKIFGGGDDRPYSRGFSLFLLALVCVIIPLFVAALFRLLLVEGGNSLLPMLGASPVITTMVDNVANALVAALYYVLAVAVIPFVMIGWMRITIYGRLSAGFQMHAIWSMMRKEFNGVLRIVGIVFFTLLIFCATLLALGLLFGSFGFFTVAAALLMGRELPSLLAGMVLTLVLAGAAMLYVGAVINVTSVVIVARALGYWTRQFDVPHWLGQDDPMPFESSVPVKPV